MQARKPTQVHHRIIISVGGTSMFPSDTRSPMSAACLQVCCFPTNMRMEGQVAKRQRQTSQACRRGVRFDLWGQPLNPHDDLVCPDACDLTS